MLIGTLRDLKNYALLVQFLYNLFIFQIIWPCKAKQNNTSLPHTRKLRLQSKHKTNYYTIEVDYTEQTKPTIKLCCK